MKNIIRYQLRFLMLSLLVMFRVQGATQIRLHNNNNPIVTNINAHVINASLVLRNLAQHNARQAYVSLPNTAIYNNNAVHIKTLFENLQKLYNKNNALITNADNHEMTLKKEILRFSLDPQAAINHAQANHLKRKGISRQLAKRVVNPAVIHTYLQLTIQLQLPLSIQKAFARYYALSLFSNIRNIQLNESKKTYMDTADLDLVVLQNKTDYNNLGQQTKNMVKQEYFYLFNRWIDNTDPILQKNDIAKAVRALVLHGKVPGPSKTPHTLALNSIYSHANATDMTYNQVLAGYLALVGQIKDIWWSGVEKKWHSLRWIRLLPKQLRSDIIFTRYQQKGDTPDNAPIESLTPEHMLTLAGKTRDQNNNAANPVQAIPRRIPYIKNMHTLTLREIAREYVKKWYGDNGITSWGVCSGNKPSHWLKYLPISFQKDIARYLMCLEIDKGKSTSKFKNMTIKTPISYLIEMKVVPLPMNNLIAGNTFAAKLAAFEQKNKRAQAQLFAQHLNRVETSKKLSRAAKDIEIEELLIRLNLYSPAFTQSIIREYAALTLMRGSLLKRFESNELFSLSDNFGNGQKLTLDSLNVGLDNLVANPNFKQKIEVKINQNKTIDLSDMHLHSLSHNAFNSINGINNVETLDISNNPIVNIAAGTFASLTGLKKIVISQTLVKKLPQNLFQQNKNLEEIHITNNKNLKELHANIFGGLDRANLKVINLSSNNLTYDKLPNMSTLQNVATLDVSNNNLTQLPINNLPKNLLSLVAKHNQLMFNGNFNGPLSTVLKEFSRLEYLDLSYNKIAWLDGFIKLRTTQYQTYLKHLKHLILTGNKLSTNKLFLKSQIAIGNNNYKFNDLKTLDLSGCGIDCILTRDFQMFPAMTRLFLHNNNINFIQSNALSTLPALTELYLQNNKFTTLKQVIFTGLRRLKSLHLEGNCIQSIAANSFASLGNLQELHLRYNKTGSLQLQQKSFARLKKLKTLDLSANNITDLPNNIFNGLLNLTHLNLSKNKIKSLKHRVFEILTSPGYAGLEYLDLSDNGLSSVYYKFLNDLSSCKNVIFYGNNVSHFGFISLTGWFNILAQRGWKFKMETSKRYFPHLTALTSSLWEHRFCYIPGAAYPVKLAMWMTGIKQAPKYIVWKCKENLDVLKKLEAKKNPQKITDYFKEFATFNGMQTQ